MLVLLSLLGCIVDPVTRPTAGDPCAAQADCGESLICAHDATCRRDGEVGTDLADDACVSTVECALDLACSSAGACTPEGAPGTAGVGEVCVASEDCRAGFFCASDGTCRGFDPPLWDGVTCEEPGADPGPFRVYFEIDGAGDFYRLPYPNDVRLRGGVIDLANHPTPGAALAGVGDVVGPVLEAAGAGDGFGPNQATIVRFSHGVDFDSIAFGLPGEGNLTVVDVTPGAPELGDDRGLSYHTSSGATPYVCHNWLAAWPPAGEPYLPGHTYALLLGASVRSRAGDPLTQDADMAAVLAEQAPAEARLTHAWQAYAPLRAWLTTTNIRLNDLGAAVVFTIADPWSDVERLRDAVDSRAIPALRGLTRCGDGDPYAVAGDATRGCQAADPTFHELQALVDLPQFQAGAPPFKGPGSGGDVALDDPRPVRTDAVHLSLTVPTGAMPAGGWPLVIYAHGTAGGYTSGVRDGLAALLADVPLDGDRVGLATLTIDGPLQAGRAFPEEHGEAWLAVDPDAYAPDLLVTNPLNPLAIRGTALQAVADLMGVARLARVLDLDDDSPTGAPLRIDPARIYVLGHGEGGAAAATFLAHTDIARAGVIASASGLTAEDLLRRTAPRPLLPWLGLGLADPEVARYHPVLNLIQQVVDPADAVNHAALLRAPLAGDAPRHVLQIVGTGDGWSPFTGQSALARALGADQVPGDSAPLPDLDEVSLPASGNARGTTAVVALYEPDGGDPHRVAFEHPEARRAIAAFLATAARDGVPTVRVDGAR